MTRDQQIVYEWMFKPDMNDGTFDPALLDVISERVAAVNNLLGCSLIVRPMRDDEVAPNVKDEPRHLVIVEAGQ